MTLLLCVSNLGFQKKVHSYSLKRKKQFVLYSVSAIPGAEAFIAMEVGRFSTSTLPFLLDDMGCNGSETNLLDCLPHHNCRSTDPENAGVQCLRKGISEFCIQSRHCSILYHLQSHHNCSLQVA